MTLPPPQQAAEPIMAATAAARLFCQSEAARAEDATRVCIREAGQSLSRIGASVTPWFPRQKIAYHNHTASCTGKTG